MLEAKIKHKHCTHSYFDVNEYFHTNNKENNSPAKLNQLFSSNFVINRVAHLGVFHVFPGDSDTDDDDVAPRTGGVSLTDHGDLPARTNIMPDYFRSRLIQKPTKFEIIPYSR